jgi:DNA-binding CsgD family transcriptional regulator
VTTHPGALGRERELWELLSFATGRDGRTTPILALAGSPGSGRSTILEMLARALGTDLAADLGTLTSTLDAAGPGGVAILDDADRDGILDLTTVARVLRRRAPGGARLVLSVDANSAASLEDAGIDVLTLTPLPATASRQILEARFGTIAGPVAELLITAADGNPRALLDFGEALTTEQLAGRGRIPDPLPLSRRAASWWERRVLNGFGPDLLALALEPTLPLAVLHAAADPDAIDEGEHRGHVVVTEDGVALRPSILRSVVAAGAESSIRTAHRELADHFAPEDADRSAWHRGLAATGRDEALALALEHTVGAARRHYGPLAVADALELAAELSPVDAAVARRRVDAAHAAWEAGWRQRAAWLLAEAAPLPDLAEVRARSALVSGVLALSDGRPDEAFRTLVRGADAAIGREDGLALDLTARAAGIAWWSGSAELAEATVSLAVRTTRSGDPWSRFVREMTAAGRDVLSGRLDRLKSNLSRVLETGGTLDDPRRLVFASESAGVLGDDVASLRFLERAVRLFSVAGAPETPFSFELLAFVHVWQGSLHAARESASRGLELAGVFGEQQEGPFQLAMRCHIAALEGDVDRATELAARVETAGGSVPTVAWALGRLEISRGRFEPAYAHLTRVVSGSLRMPIVELYLTPDLVESAVESGRVDESRAALDRFQHWGEAGSPWALAVLPRLQAMLSDGEERIAALTEAARHPETTRRPFEEARALLLLGRELRQARRRSESREPFRAALATFELFGLEAWAQRTRAELRAAGESAASGSSRDPLTAQELQIAGLVADGASNREVAAALHLSSRTVEYHLSKVYVKLGVTGRAQLAAGLASS